MTMRIVPAVNGWRWISQGLALYRQHLLPLLGISAIFIVSAGVVSFIPFLGHLLLSLAGPFILVGMLNTCRNLENGQPFSFEAFSQPFQEKAGALMGVAALYLVATMGVVLICAVLFFVGGLVVGLSGLSGLSANANGLPFLGILLIVLVVLFLFIPILMCYWFAPFLIAWRDRPVFSAVSESFWACLKNWQAFLVNGLVWTLVSVVVYFLGGFFVWVSSGLVSANNPADFIKAVIAIGLIAFLITVLIFPLVWTSLYYCYLDIFPETEEPDAQPVFPSFNP